MTHANHKSQQQKIASLGQAELIAPALAAGAGGLIGAYAGDPKKKLRNALMGAGVGGAIGGAAEYTVPGVGLAAKYVGQDTLSNLGSAVGHGPSVVDKIQKAISRLTEAGSYGVKRHSMLPGLGLYDKVMGKQGSVSANLLYRAAMTEKVAGPVSEVGSVVNPLNLYGGATLGGLAALATPTRSLQQQAEFDSQDGALRALTNILVPGVGAYRGFKRIGAGIRSPEMKAIKAQQLQDKSKRELAALQQAHGADDASAKAAGWKSEMAGIMLNPLNMFGGNILGGAAAAVTPTRTLDEQAAADNTIAANLLVPGVASHNHWKRIGAATRSPEMLAMRRKATIDRLQRQAGGGNAKEEEVAPQETAEELKAAASEWKGVDLATNPINWTRTLPKADASAKNWQGAGQKPAAPPMVPVNQAPPMAPGGAAKAAHLRNFGAKVAGFNIGDLAKHIPEGLKKVMPAAGAGALGGAALGGLAGLIAPGHEDIYDDEGNVVGRQRRGRFGAAMRGALGGGVAGGLAGGALEHFRPGTMGQAQSGLNSMRQMYNRNTPMPTKSV